MLNHQTLLEASNIAIYYNFVDDWIYVKWMGNSSVEEIKAGAEKILYFMKAQRCSKVLNDHSLRTGIWSESIDWIEKDWLPRMEAAGLKMMALVYPLDRYSQLSTDKAVAQITTNISFLTFHNIETAKD